MGFVLEKMMNGYEKCKKCGRTQRLAWAVKNEIWNAVANSKTEVLCLECFLEMAESVHYHVGKSDFEYFAFASSRASDSVLIDEIKKGRIDAISK